jgi:hypothetical protein
MQGDSGRVTRPSGKLGLLAALAAIAVLAGFLTIGFAPSAQALPSFARQTGQPCGSCHTDFPGLTPYGRRFKLLGYTTGGGAYQTTPFSSKASIDARAEYDKLRGYANEVTPPPPTGGDKGWVPPISAMLVVGDTHLAAPMSAPTDPYKPNDNIVASPLSFFWGGAITNNIGAFAQVTRNAPDLVVNTVLPNGQPDPYAHNWTWDNTDVRFAATTMIGGLDLVYGITANNSPTVQDLWNTTPAWAFPYAAPGPGGAAGPSAGTMLEGAFAARVGGVGAYAMINDLLYLEATIYRTLTFSQQNSLGSDPIGSPGLFNYAPYWRIAFEPHWGPHTLMVGSFGTTMDVHPWNDPNGLVSQGVVPQFDRYTDVGFDTQYQYQGSNYWLTLRGSFIREYQTLNATFNGFNPASGSANPTNILDSMRLYGSVALGGDNRVVLTGQYFKTSGTADAGLYGFDTNGVTALGPNSDGWTAEIAYIPFGVSKSPGWPWFNARIGLQYTYFNKFNGTTVGAQNNNTLFLHAWMAM